MADKTANKFKILFYEVISALVITFSVIPGFNNIGRLFYQFFITFTIVFLFLLISDPEKFKPATVSHSLIFMTVFWVVTALYEQIKLHISYHDKSLIWRFLFYYDRPALLIVVYFSVFLFFAFKLIKNNSDENFISEYRKYLKPALISFTVYYAIILFYCFFLVRTGGDSTDPVNLVPFHVFEAMKAGEYEYEFIFLFCGNIAIFMPLGFLVSIFIKKKPVIILMPFAVSILIEFSQYIFKNGQADIDDVILNVIGFFIGFFIKILLDKLISKATNGRLNSVFLL